MSNRLVGLGRKLEDWLVTRLFTESFFLLLSHRRRAARRGRLKLLQNPQTTTAFFKMASDHPEVIAATSTMMRVLDLLETAQTQAREGQSNVDALSQAIRLLENSDLGSVLAHTRRSRIRPA